MTLTYNPKSLLDLFTNVKRQRDGQYSALCPAHDDRSPSLGIRFNDETGRVLVNCLAGCPLSAVLHALRIGPSHLRYTPHSPTPSLGKSGLGEISDLDRSLILQARLNANRGLLVTPDQFQASMRFVNWCYKSGESDSFPPFVSPAAGSISQRDREDDFDLLFEAVAKMQDGESVTPEEFEAALRLTHKHCQEGR